jgi:hypothetical protein
VLRAGAVGQGRVPLLPRLEVPRDDSARKIRQGFGNRKEQKLDGSEGGCLSAVAAWLEH